jgi:hypothetical protein
MHAHSCGHENAEPTGSAPASLSLDRRLRGQRGSAWYPTQPGTPSGFACSAWAGLSRTSAPGRRAAGTRARATPTWSTRSSHPGNSHATKYPPASLRSSGSVRVCCARAREFVRACACARACVRARACVNVMAMSVTAVLTQLDQRVFDVLDAMPLPSARAALEEVRAYLSTACYTSPPPRIPPPSAVAPDPPPHPPTRCGALTRPRAQPDP